MIPRRRAYEPANARCSRALAAAAGWFLLLLWIAGVRAAGIHPDANPAPELKTHWSFRPPVRRPPPDVQRGDWAKNPIDQFILARLEAKSLAPSPQADRRTLIRRLYLVMLGMPPTPEEVSEFLADKRQDAFEHLVDRVLADPRYGETWGRHWLDIVRFAESNGFETNRERPNAWRFRDYVIAAFNEDKPYNQFIREQIAGDSLGADVATGFLVGGPVDIVKSPDVRLTAQQRADELDDMVATTGTAFLGLTVGCARCHAHKFDPIAQSEYYSLTAIFAGVNHGERPLPLPEERQKDIARLEARIKDLEHKLAPFQEKAASAREATQEMDDRAGTTTRPQRPAVNPVRNEENLVPLSAKFLRFTILETTGAEPCIDELEVYSGRENVALASRGTKVTASGTLPGYAIHKLEHINDGRLGNNHSWISNEGGRGWVQLEFSKPERIDKIVWSRDREGVFKDRLATKYRIEAGVDTNSWQLVASSDDRAVYHPSTEKPPGPVYRFTGWPAAKAQEAKDWLADLQNAQKQYERLKEPPMIYAGTFSEPGPSFVLQRGDAMQPREVALPATLALYQPLTMATNLPEKERRLRFADWLVDPHHPLTTRVVVNRLWQYQFGVGLVDTPNDFGRNGARPTHPDLLDWLATELVSKGWSIKALQREILTSATWRQASAPRAEASKLDAQSRLLWRFPPRRLEAEAIRDSILAVSGHLDRTMGGPSFFLHNVDRENVYHYQAKEEFGPEESRRMVYAFKVRMEQDSIFGAFDCPDGSLVTPKRSVSTTPLQALNLFNSRFTLQQAGFLAERVLREAGSSSQAQISRAWELAFNRPPAPDEAKEALAFAQREGVPALCRALFNSNEFLFIP